MIKILKITKREYVAAVRTKAFLAGLLLGPVLMGGGLIAMYLFEDQVDLADKVIGVIDRSGRIVGKLAEAAETRNTEVAFAPSSGRQVQPIYRIQAVDPAGRRPDAVMLELSDQVRARRLHGFVDIGPDVLYPPEDSPELVRYYAENPAFDGVREWVQRAINDEVRRQRLVEIGVDPSEAPAIFTWLEAEPMELLRRGADGGIEEGRKQDAATVMGIPMALAFMMFLMIMMGAVPLLNSVMEEKTQGIAEMILGSATPFQFMMGKVLGGLAVSLTASAVYICVGLIALTNMGASGLIPFHVLPWFLAYMVLAILMSGAIMAALGAACSDARDAQNLALPGILPVLIPMFLLIPVLKEPSSVFATGISLFPLFTPVLMMLRLGSPASIPVWQPLVGLVGVFGAAVLAVWAGSRVFRIAILMQGQPPRLDKLLRWAFRG